VKPFNAEPAEGAFMDGIENLHAQDELRGLLKFETLLSGLTATLVNLSAEKIDRQIEYVIQRVVEFCNVDRGTVFQIINDGTHVLSTHSWARQGYEGPPLGNIMDNILPWAIEQVRKGETLVWSSIDDIPAEAAMERKVLLEEGQKSIVAIPLMTSGHVFGAVTFDSIRREKAWTSELVKRLKLIGEIFGNALDRKRQEEKLHQALEQIKELTRQLKNERNSLREEIKLEHNFDEIIGQSMAMRIVLGQVERVAPTDTNVIITGETGTGKELIARAIHSRSKRSDRPLVKVNCAALSSSLIESELFGHEKGAFTGAHATRIGRFELADKATLFLDEVGELAWEVQAKLLRVLQEGEFERLGSHKTLKTDVRVIAATNRDLEEEVRQKRFRQDLWYRLNVFPVPLPPLRERIDDIPLLVNWFVNKSARKLGKKINRIPRHVMNSFEAYPWPGNIRELENVIERAIINSMGTVLKLTNPTDLYMDATTARSTSKSLPEMERDYIIQVLEENNWRISGDKGAALVLGLNPSTLRGKMRKLGIKRP
jgi:formate hydrogenlyase transcriptional activator